MIQFTESFMQRKIAVFHNNLVLIETKHRIQTSLELFKDKQMAGIGLTLSMWL